MIDNCASDISLVIEAARAVLKYHSFKDAAQKIFDLCKKATGATAGYVALLSKDGSENEVLFLDSGGMPCSVDPSLPMPIRGLRADAYHSREPVYENDFASSKWMNFMPRGHVMMKNVMFAPMILEDNAIGILGLANKRGNFTDSDAEWAGIFAEIAAIALHNSYLVETLEKSEQRYHKAYDRTKFYRNLLAHDIKNIFQVILSSTEISERILKENGEITKALDMLGLIKKQFEKGIKLISNVQKLSELDEEDIELGKIEVTELIQKSIEFVNASFKSRTIQVTRNFNREKFYTKASMILQDVFDNILHNAVKYSTESTPVEISIEISRKVLDSSKFLQVEFKDNGNGIPDEKKQFIFQKTHGKVLQKKGWGIGLSLVKKAVENFGGKIWVEDHVQGNFSQGSNFILLLPEVQ